MFHLHKKLINNQHGEYLSFPDTNSLFNIISVLIMSPPV